MDRLNLSRHHRTSTCVVVLTFASKTRYNVTNYCENPAPCIHSERDVGKNKNVVINLKGYCTPKWKFIHRFCHNSLARMCHSCLQKERGDVGMLSNRLFIWTGVSPGSQEWWWSTPWTIATQQTLTKRTGAFKHRIIREEDETHLESN